MATTTATLPIATPAIAPLLRPCETEGEGVAVAEPVPEVVGGVWDVEFEEFMPVIVPSAVVTGLRRTVDVYPGYSAQPYPTEP
jgi:hypothetical protein